MNFLLYARKSSDREDQQMLSIDAQLSELHALARKHSIRITREYIETRTAKDPGRPIFNEMIAAIRRDSTDGILSWHPDRLARNALDGGMVIYLLDTGHLRSLKFSSFWFENTPQGKFMLQIAFGQSKYFVDNLSENIKRGMREKIRRGEFPQKAPLGYCNEPRLRTIVVDDKKAPLVRIIFRRYATGRYTLDEITVAANALGLRTPKGLPFNAQSMTVFLRRVHYDGKFPWHGRAEQGTHPRLFPALIFKRVQKVLRREKKRRCRPDFISGIAPTTRLGRR